MASERLNAAIAEMAKQDITFANCDSTWQKRVMTAVLAAADTRPAPAATDTGLKTIGFVPPMFVEGKGADYNDIFRSVSIAENYTAVVTRSQAEKLLAAKDEQLREINELLDAGQGDDDGAQILPDFEDGMSILGKVEACLALLEDRRDVIEGYEAKLAAEKALEPFADHAKERAVDAPEWRDTDTVQIVVTIGDLRAARAALGGKPS